MKIIESLSKEQMQQLVSSVNVVKASIESYLAKPDTECLKNRLCDVIDHAPNVCYLDPDVLDGYDIEVDEPHWVELDEDEQEYCNDNLKEIIRDIDEFQPYQLSFGSSGSILFTIFGDAYGMI